MEVPEGFEIVRKEEDKIIMEKRWGENGRIAFVVNPYSDTDKRQQIINEAGKILLNNINCTDNENT